MVSKFRVVQKKIGDFAFDYGEPGAEFFIVMKGSVSIQIPRH
jgi:hypothetical protein